MITASTASCATRAVKPANPVEMVLAVSVSTNLKSVRASEGITETPKAR